MPELIAGFIMGSLTVVHVHPDKRIKNKRITYTYDCSVDDCDKRASSNGIYLHIMRDWYGAVPVRINGGDINPFASGDIRVGIGDPCSGFTWVVYYDYVKPQYNVSISAG